MCNLYSYLYLYLLTKFVFIDTDHKGCHHNLTLVQYVLSSEQVLDIKPHGNSKKEESYLRISVSILKSLKSKLKSASPISAKSVGSLPRNRQQVYNIKKQLRLSRSCVQLDSGNAEFR